MRKLPRFNFVKITKLSVIEKKVHNQNDSDLYKASVKVHFGNKLFGVARSFTPLR